MSRLDRLSTCCERTDVAALRSGTDGASSREDSFSDLPMGNTVSQTAGANPPVDDAAEKSSILRIGGIPTTVISRKQLAQQMQGDCRSALSGRLAEPKLVMASNGSVIARYHFNNSFRNSLSKASIIDADGASLVFASRLFCRIPLPERVATTDLIHDCAELASREQIRFYFLGGKPGVASRASQRLKLLYPNLHVVGCRDGYFDRADEDKICSDILRSGAQVLWLGLGSPLQEEIACSWQSKLAGLAWIRTCGGLFDHIAEDVPRAPRWMQDAGLEWLYRMYQEPRRLSLRYLWSNPVAVFHLLTKTSDRTNGTHRIALE
ncbi:WecB/TagA/CpsF family glycosyltransferase [Methylobacterium sp. P5_C11]